jgi:hypothetical protein
MLAPVIAVIVVVLLFQQTAAGLAAISVTQKYISAWQLFTAGQWTPEMERYVYPSRERAEFALTLFRRESFSSVGR